MPTFEAIDTRIDSSRLQAITHLFMTELYTEQPWFNYYEHGICAHNAYCLFADDGSLLGAISGDHNEGNGITKVIDLAINPGERGVGYGKLCMKFFAEQAQLHGDAKVVLYPTVEASGFYKSLGFTAFADDEGYVVAGVDRLVSSPISKVL